MDTQSTTLQSPSTYSSSSKSGSSHSSATSKTDREEDFTKDNALSPIDLECRIQCERITKIFDEVIYKVKLAICLPNLIYKKILNALLTDQDYEEVTLIYEQYDNELFSSSTGIFDTSATMDLKAGNISITNRLNPEQAHLMSLLNSYDALEPVVEEMILQTRPPQPALEYLLALEHFRDLIIRQMETTAADELALKFTVRKIEHTNEDLVKKIKEYSKSLKEERENFEETMVNKENIIAKLENDLALVYLDSDMRIKKQMLESDRQMVVKSRSHAVRYEILKDDNDQIRESYETCLKSNMNDEKILRARRFKCETQLITWVQKYDIEMFDKQTELDEFIEKFDEESKLCETLEEQLAEIDKEYIPLMEEREEEYHQEMTNKMDAFLHVHAARVIQYAWRQVLLNRQEKKKLKKAVKKMQEEKAAAELAAERRELRLKLQEKKRQQEEKKAKKGKK